MIAPHEIFFGMTVVAAFVGARVPSLEGVFVAPGTLRTTPPLRSRESAWRKTGTSGSSFVSH